jgi:phosphatidylglycerophosphate synthase
MFSAKVGHALDAPLGPLAKRVPLNPNVLTVAGFFLTACASLVIPFNLRLGGALIVAGGLLDIFDGVVARTNGKTTRFGAFLDSVLDRYSDALLFLSVAYYCAGSRDIIGAYLSLGTLVGAFVISYARARAEGLGESCHTGIMERGERIILLAIATLTGWITPVLWIMFPLTHITVIQRVYHVRQLLSRKG